MLKNLYLIVGPSGVGKTTIANELTKRFGYFQVRSFTTRPRRFETEEGYLFVTEEEFSKLPQKVAQVTFNGFKYAANAQELNNNDLYIVDPSGVEAIKAQYNGKPVFVIGLTALENSLMERMMSRGDVLPYIKERLANDEKVFAGFTKLCDKIIINDKLETTLLEIQNFIQKCEQESLPS